MILMLELIWWIIGIASALFWMTRDYDFRTNDMLEVLIIGLFGPLAFIGGLISYIVDRLSYPNTILIRNRRHKK